MGASAAFDFHQRTRYVRRGVEIVTPAGAAALGAQDEANEPAPFKIYPALPAIALPDDPFVTSLSALDALISVPESGSLELSTLTHICLRANGVMRRWVNPWGKTVLFRGAGCTGARYHLEIYIASADLPGLPAGLYHYDAQDHALRMLRPGDHRGALVAASGGHPAVADAPVTLAITSTFWRNAWRYLDRAYRHAYWDLGTLLANVIPVAASAGSRAEVVLGFADDPVNALLGVDGEREATLALVPLGSGRAVPQSVPSAPPLEIEVEPVSASEIPMPEIWAIHRATGLASGEAAADWRAQSLRRTSPAVTGSVIPLTPLSAQELPADSIDSVIRNRRSNRHYLGEQPLPFALFSTVLARSLRNPAIDALDPSAPPLHDVYLVVNNVEGLVPGTYFLYRDQLAVELLRAGDLRAEAAHTACGQDYVAEAHVNVYALVDLPEVIRHYGDRGFRLAQTESGLFGGRIQLAAHALGLGAVGSTSVDDEVIELFSPHAAAKQFMFVAVFGLKRKPNAAEMQEKYGFLKPETKG